jgi:hypothetical protein
MDPFFGPPVGADVFTVEPFPSAHKDKWPALAFQLEPVHLVFDKAYPHVCSRGKLVSRCLARAPQTPCHSCFSQAWIIGLRSPSTGRRFVAKLYTSEVEGDAYAHFDTEASVAHLVESVVPGITPGGWVTAQVLHQSPTLGPRGLHYQGIISSHGGEDMFHAIRLRRVFALGVPGLYALAFAVLRMVGAFHEAGFTHNDLKATNITIGAASTYLIDLEQGAFCAEEMPPMHRFDHQRGRTAEDRAWFWEEQTKAYQAVNRGGCFQTRRSLTTTAIIDQFSGVAEELHSPSPALAPPTDPAGPKEAKFVLPSSVTRSQRLMESVRKLEAHMHFHHYSLASSSSPPSVRHAHRVKCDSAALGCVLLQLIAGAGPMSEDALKVAPTPDDASGAVAKGASMLGFANHGFEDAPPCLLSADALVDAAKSLAAGDSSVPEAYHALIGAIEAKTRPFFATGEATKHYCHAISSLPVDPRVVVDCVGIARSRFLAALLHSRSVTAPTDDGPQPAAVSRASSSSAATSPVPSTLLDGPQLPQSASSSSSAASSSSSSAEADAARLSAMMGPPL